MREREAMTEVRAGRAREKCEGVNSVGVVDGGKRHKPRNGQSLEAGKGKETNCPLGPLEGTALLPS